MDPGSPDVSAKATEPPGPGRRVHQERVAAELGQPDGTGSWDYSCGALQSSVPHPTMQCACQQSPKPSGLARDCTAEVGDGRSSLTPSPVRAGWGYGFASVKERKRMEKASDRVLGVGGWRLGQVVSIHPSCFCQWQRREPSENRSWPGCGANLRGNSLNLSM